MSDQGEKLKDAAEAIAAEGESVRERVRTLLVDAVRGDSFGASSIRDAARSIADGLASGVRDASADTRSGVLREAVEGLSDGFGRAAHATRLAVEEARGRGETFTESDLKSAAADLGDLEKLLGDTLTRLAGRVGDEAKGGGRDLIDHADRAIAAARPSIERAIDAIRANPAGLVADTGQAGANAARGAAGSIFGLAAGLLDAAGDIARGAGGTPAKPATASEKAPSDAPQAPDGESTPHEGTDNA